MGVIGITKYGICIQSQLKVKTFESRDVMTMIFRDKYHQKKIIGLDHVCIKCVEKSSASLKKACENTNI